MSRSSSASSFMRQIEAAINAKTGFYGFLASVSQIDLTEKRLVTPYLLYREQVALLVLPPRGMADQLI